MSESEVVNIHPSPSPPVLPAIGDEEGVEAPDFSHEEYQYINLINEILGKDEVRQERTGTGTKAVFVRLMRFSLANGTLPLLTTKHVHFKSVVEELLWMISGSTSAKELDARGCKIWNANGSREALDKAGLTQREENDLGPIYGFQWRHFGAKYKDMHTNYEGQGVDQLAECIHKIKHKPTDRRIVMSAWNPADLAEMALPPCHMFCQFFVEGKKLSCSMYQRSCDVGLGVPFNIASYALLTHLVAHVCGLEAHEFHHVLGDTHIYVNHIDALKKQVERTPRPFPTIKFNRKVERIDDFVHGDFSLLDYDPHPAIKMEMSV